VSVLVVAQSSSEITEGIMNNPVFSFIVLWSCFKCRYYIGHGCTWYTKLKALL